MSAPPPFLFGVSQFTTTPWSFKQDVESYAELGVDAIEVCEFKLDKDRFAEQLALVGEQGLSISSVQPAVRTLFPTRMQPEPKDLQERIARFRQTIERFGQFARGVPFVCSTGPPPEGNVREVFEVATGEYRSLADFAREYGASIALEPLNPVLMNVETAIWTVEQAMQVVAAVDRPNFGVCLDTWNVWQNAGVESAIEACGDRIFVVQVGDWRTPRSYADRHAFGQGYIPHSRLLRAIHERGYRGPYTLEIFSDGVPDSLWDSDLTEVIEASRAELERAWRKANGPS